MSDTEGRVCRQMTCSGREKNNSNPSLQANETTHIGAAGDTDVQQQTCRGGVGT